MEWIIFENKKPQEKDKQYLIAIRYDEKKFINFFEISFWDGEHFKYWDDYNDCEMHYNENDVYAWMEIPKCEIKDEKDE